MSATDAVFEQAQRCVWIAMLDTAFQSPDPLALEKLQLS